MRGRDAGEAAVTARGVMVTTECPKCAGKGRVPDVVYSNGTVDCWYCTGRGYLSKEMPIEDFKTLLLGPVTREPAREPR